MKAISADDPKVQRALRMGRTRSQQADMLGVTTRTVQRLVHGTVSRFRGSTEHEAPDVAHDVEGNEIVPGDTIIYRTQKGGAFKKSADVLEILPPLAAGDLPFRLRIKPHHSTNIAVLKRVDLVKVQA